MRVCSFVGVRAWRVWVVVCGGEVRDEMPPWCGDGWRAEMCVGRGGKGGGEVLSAASLYMPDGMSVVDSMLTGESDQEPEDIGLQATL